MKNVLVLKSSKNVSQSTELSQRFGRGQGCGMGTVVRHHGGWTWVSRAIPASGSSVAQPSVRWWKGLGTPGLMSGSGIRPCVSFLLQLSPAGHSANECLSLCEGPSFILTSGGPWPSHSKEKVAVRLDFPRKED